MDSTRWVGGCRRRIPPCRLSRIIPLREVAWTDLLLRLRKAVRTAIAGSRSAEHELSRDLNAQMMSKLGATRGLKERLERELKRVRNETAQVETQRSSLVNALESKRCVQRCKGVGHRA